MKCKKLKRLTIANPQNAKSNTEQLMNFAYAKDNKVFIPQPYKDDIDLCEYISKLTKVKGCNLPPEEIMEGACLECDHDCEIGILYYCAVQAAELREHLKMFEDKLENGTLIEMPCKCEKNKRGIKAWRVGENPNANDWNDEPWYKITPYTILGESKSGKAYLVERNGWHGKKHQHYVPKRELYLDYSEAEAKLKELKENV